MSRLKKTTRNIFRAGLYIFSIIGFIFVGVYFAMQNGWLNVKGSISERNAYFNFKKNQSNQVMSMNDIVIACQINVLGRYAPLTAINIFRTLSRGTDEGFIKEMIKTASKRFEDDNVYTKTMNNCNTENSVTVDLPMSAYYWADTDEWNLMKEVFIRDQDVIKKAALDANISPRLILSSVIGEQFRFFSSRRESFKSYFEPLKILATLSNTSYGIAGLKPKTVGIIEANLKDPKSQFYLGSDMENLTDYRNVGVDELDARRLDRITDTKNPYYSYLYVGLFMKEIEAQWKRAGYDISNRPEVLATLYNLGFYYSVPKPDPKVGGTVININNVDYTFGDLAYEFYYSGELADIFPIGVE